MPRPAERVSSYPHQLSGGMRQRLGMAVILVTHDIGVIAGRADRVAVMYARRIV